MKASTSSLLVLPLLLALGACSTVKYPSTTGSSGSQTAQHFSVTQTRTLSADYLLYLPAGYETNSGRRWPLIFFLHGAGERGSDVWMVAKHGPPKVDTRMTNFPFIVVSPQCPDGKIWSNDLLLALLDDVEKQYAVDLHRVYLTGLSMGGYGAWSLGLSYPERFAAMAPFWAIPAETLPRAVAGVVMGLVNAFGNLGGFAGPYLVGWLKNEYHRIDLPFDVLGVGMLVCAGLAFLLPKSPRPISLTGQH